MKKKKNGMVIVSVVLILILALAVLLVWQRQNLRAVQLAGQYTQAELQDKLTENQEKVNEAVSAAQGLQVRDLTEEEKEALKEGALTRDELVQMLTGGDNGTEPSPAETETPAPTESAEPEAEVPEETRQPEESALPTPTEELEEAPAEAEQSAAELRLSELVAEVYILRAEMLGAIDGLVADARSEYLALEVKSSSAKTALMRTYVGKAGDLERSCDAQMEGILSEMRSILAENGGDFSLADAVETTYQDEKALTKASYMSQYSSFLG